MLSGVTRENRVFSLVYAQLFRLFRKRGVRSAECGVRSAECGVRSAECGVRSAECGVRSAECGVRSLKKNNEKKEKRN